MAAEAAWSFLNCCAGKEAEVAAQLDDEYGVEVWILEEKVTFSFFDFPAAFSVATIGGWAVASFSVNVASQRTGGGFRETSFLSSMDAVLLGACSLGCAYSILTPVEVSCNERRNDAKTRLNSLSCLFNFESS